MKIQIVGGGPAGLFFAIVMKRRDATHEITVFERNAPHETFGWGVVFSDETASSLRDADPESYALFERSFARWDAIETHRRGTMIRSGGHGFSAIARRTLLEILEQRCTALGVSLRFRNEIDDVDALARDCDLLVSADGLRSRVRAGHEAAFKPTLDARKCRYIWLGTTRVYEAFTFLFGEDKHGFVQVHAYPFDREHSTFIAECDEDTWRNAGLDRATTDASIAYLEALFADSLAGHRLLANNSAWIQFNTVRTQSWSTGNIVLLGDAAHTAHFSIGSGTKLAMEDSIALAHAFGETPDVRAALARYETERRPIVERTQWAAESSLSWFENVRRYRALAAEPLVFSMLTRSKKVTYENLKLRDKAFVDRIARWHADHAPARPESAPGADPPPPMFTPLRLRGLTLPNRVGVSPMCMYSADDGTPGEFHLVHLGSRATGGAGLVMAEMTDVARDGRISLGCTGLYKPDHEVAWRRIVEFVHTQTRAKIGIQLGHAGRKGATKRLWEGADQPLGDAGWSIMAPSAIPYLPHSQVPREMTRDDMTRVRQQFVAAASMADRAGFDLIELHCAHGYLLSSFISPLTNRRTDAYGGDIAARARFPLEVFDAVRAVWPNEKPMSVRISAADWAPRGLSEEDAVRLGVFLREHGCDIIDVSTGQTTPDAKPVYGRMYQTPYSDLIRNEVGIPSMTVGAISSADQVNTIIAAQRADVCLLARPHLADPYWTLHAATEQGYDAFEWPLQYVAARPAPSRALTPPSRPGAT